MNLSLYQFEEHQIASCCLASTKNRWQLSEVSNYCVFLQRLDDLTQLSGFTLRIFFRGRNPFDPILQ